MPADKCPQCVGAILRIAEAPRQRLDRAPRIQPQRLTRPLSAREPAPHSEPAV
jgi:hypothetical protein